MTLSERILIDHERDLVTIDGVVFSGPALDFFTRSSPPGLKYTTERVGNHLIVHRFADEVAPA